MAKTTTRVQFEMAKESFDRLVALKDKIEASSHAEVIRRALQLYEFVIEEEEKGGGVSIKTVEDGEIIYRSVF